jgi:hypothetical protein
MKLSLLIFKLTGQKALYRKENAGLSLHFLFFNRLWNFHWYFRCVAADSYRLLVYNNSTDLFWAQTSFEYFLADLTPACCAFA